MNLSKYRSNADSSMMQEDASVIKPSNNSELSEVLCEVVVYIQKDSDRSLLLGDEDAQTVNDFMFFQKIIQMRIKRKWWKQMLHCFEPRPLQVGRVGVNS